MQSSNLLISESPLQVLPSLAVAIGLNEAIALQQLHYWLERSHNERDDARWVYNDYTEWQKQFPFWSARTIQRTFLNLEQRGLVRTEMFGKASGDKTKWYTIDYATLNNLEQTHRANLAQCPSCQVGTMIVPDCRDDGANLAHTLMESETTTEITPERVETAQAPHAASLESEPTNQPDSTSTQPDSKPQKKRVADPNLHHEAVQAYRATCRLTPNAVQRQAIASAIGDDEHKLSLWRQCCERWMTKGYRPQNVADLLDNFTKTYTQHQDEAKRRAAQEALYQRPTQAQPARHVLTLEERRAALEQYRRQTEAA